jgi:hypothetical protein
MKISWGISFGVGQTGELTGVIFGECCGTDWRVDWSYCWWMVWDRLESWLESLLVNVVGQTGGLTGVIVGEWPVTWDMTTELNVIIAGDWTTWRTTLHNVLIFIFISLHVSSTSCSSSGATNCVSTTSGSCHSVSVAVLFSDPTCTIHGHRYKVTVTRGCIDTICLSWWWARCARNM